ncbi:hypothetical protein AXJ10_gp65 [Gordonia phage GordTnk2]|uniref:Uncharacterized protein n=1 Tax=Gordonia phage GordTnk2 TaxID=1622192 RepID=A0A0E3T7U7_9CAUD|nr:hypothetical protein AXJ10_gp65 [Gordonia phage GordTnk2]AKC02805.1 hypothetical protein GordTnk2_65 [Gordonia phage GordTnk2]
MKFLKKIASWRETRRLYILLDVLDTEIAAVVNTTNYARENMDKKYETVSDLEKLNSLETGYFESMRSLNSQLRILLQIREVVTKLIKNDVISKASV